MKSNNHAHHSGRRDFRRIFRMSRIKKTIILAGLLLVAVFVLTFPSYRADMKAARDRINNFQSSFLETEFGLIEYAVSGEGYPLLISHGIQGGFDQGLALADMYIGEGYKIIAPSRFGYLHSNLPEEPTPLKQAEAFAALLDGLAIEKAVILGNSAGGSAAFQFAVRFPERCAGLILISSSVPDTRPLPPQPVISLIFHSDYIYWLSVQLAKKSMLSMFIPQSITAALSEQELDRYFNDVLLGSLPVSRRAPGALNDMYLTNRDINRGYAYEEIEAPVLMFHAEDDPLPAFNEALKISERIKNLEFHPFETGGHLLIGHFDFIKSKTEQFLEKTAKPDE